MSISDTAHQFFEACETGKGWEACKPFCHPHAGFSCQADALAEIGSLEAYCQWMQNLLVPIPDGHYELKSWAVDEARDQVVAYAVFQGTNTGPGAVTPTRNTVASDYVYVMQFETGKIRSMVKIWNDGFALKQLGWG